MRFVSLVDQVLDRLRTSETGGPPLLSLSADLTPGPTGIPTARQAIKQAWRDVEATFPDLEHDALRSYLQDQSNVEQAIEESTAGGSHGLFYFGCAAQAFRIELETPLPPRNSVRLATRPALFELLRYRYLRHRPAVVAAVTRHGVRALRVHYGDIEAEVAFDEAERAVTGPHGRTDTQGVGSAGTAGAGGPATRGGQHGKSRIEKSILAHEQVFARESAAQLLELVEEGDVLVLAGPEEARAELLHQLPDSMRHGTIEAPALDPTLPDADLAQMASDVVTEHQYDRARHELERWASGDLGGRAVAGARDVLAAIHSGQLETLLVFEEAVPHLGTSTDAREHEGPIDPAVADELVRGALDVAADCLVLPGSTPTPAQAVLGILRWA